MSSYSGRECKDKYIDYCAVTVIEHLRRSGWQGGHGRKKGSRDFLSLLVERFRRIRKWSKGRQLAGWRTSRPAPVTHFVSTAS